MIPVRMRLPLAMLKELVFEGPLDQAWVVLVGDREPLRTTLDGQPVYGGIVVWDPVPAPPLGEGEAMVLAERLGVASLGVEPDQWLWHPATDEGDEALELYAVVDGDEVRPEVAIAPLAALLAEEPGISREGR